MKRIVLLLGVLALSCISCKNEAINENVVEVSPVWKDGEESLPLIVSSSIISGSLTLKVISSSPQSVNWEEDISAILINGERSFPMNVLQPSFSGDLLSFNLSMENDEGITSLSKDAVIEINLGAKTIVNVPCTAKLAKGIYFETPGEEYEEGLILDSGEYALLKADKERGGWELLVGVQGDEPMVVWIDETGLFRMIALGEHGCMFEFEENSFDIFWNDSEPDSGIPYRENADEPFALTKADSYSTYRNGDLFACMTKLQSVLSTYSDFFGLKRHSWMQEARYLKKVNRFRRGFALLLVDQVFPEEFEIVHDAVAIGGLVASILSVNPIGIAFGLWEVGSLAVQRYYFGYATLKTLEVNPLSATEAECKAKVENLQWISWPGSRSSEVQFIINGSNQQGRTESVLLSGDMAQVNVNQLTPGGEYTCRTRMYRVWIHNNDSHKNFGLRQEDFTRDLKPFNERIDRSWVSLDGGEVDFIMPTPGATTGSATSVTSNSAILECKFHLADGFPCGVAISSNDKTWTVNASPSSTSVPVGALEPMTTYSYWAYVNVNGTPYNGEIKEFTTEMPSLAGTWGCTVYSYNYAGKKYVSDQFSLVLYPDHTIGMSGSNISFKSGSWSQYGKSLGVDIISYAYDSYPFYSGGYYISGTVVDDSFNKITGYWRYWNDGPNGAHEGDGLEIVMER